MVTKLRNEITNFCQRPDESLFEAWEHYKLSIDRCPNHNMLPVTQIDTFYNGLTLRHRDTINAAAGGTFMKRHPEECYDLIENMTAHHNDLDTSTQRSESSSFITSSSDTKITALKAEVAEINKNLMRVLQVNQQVKAVTQNCETCGGPHSFSDCPATVGNTETVYAIGAYQGIKETIILKGTIKEETNSSRELTKANDAILKNMQTNMTYLTNLNLELKNMFGKFMKMNTTSSWGSGTLSGNTTTNPKEDLKVIITRRRSAYPGSTIPTTSSSPVVERETKATKDTIHPTNNGNTEDVQPSVVPTESLILNFELVNSSIIELVASPVEAKALPTNDARVVCKFLKSLFARFETPRAIISDRAYENSLIYGEKTKRLHDSKIKDRVFNVGDRVLLFNYRLNIFSGKLKTHWSGPFTITHVFPYGTVELSQTDGPNLKVNGHRLKHYLKRTYQRWFSLISKLSLRTNEFGD
nr:reverse transcriptase domain-containing protein [Tanacetum cinerariifolium]